MKLGIKKYFKLLGPGVITGAADNDPSGIATYSQAGAKFGYGLLWTQLFSFPLLLAVQEACVRITTIRQEGIAEVIRNEYGKKVLTCILTLLVIANTINIGADLGAMASAFQLIVPMNFILLIIIFAAIIILLQIFIKFKQYEKMLKYLCLFLLAYPITLIIIAPNPTILLKETFIPHMEFNYEVFFMITGLLGTTISPYLMFWQSAQVIEKEQDKKLFSKHNNIKQKTYILNNLRVDNFFGICFSQIVSWFIIATTATVLHQHGITEINTASDAARALEPFVKSFPHAGFIAKFIFAIGVLGLGFLSIPTLSGSSAYAICEGFNWRSGMNLKFKYGHGFYGVMIISTFIGVLFNFFGFSPMKALVFAAVLNGVVAVPLILLIILISNNKKIMQNFKNGWLANTFLFLALACMGIAGLAMILSLFI